MEKTTQKTIKEEMQKIKKDLKEVLKDSLYYASVSDYTTEEYKQALDTEYDLFVRNYELNLNTGQQKEIKKIIKDIYNKQKIKELKGYDMYIFISLISKKLNANLIDDGIYIIDNVKTRVLEFSNLKKYEKDQLQAILKEFQGELEYFTIDNFNLNVAYKGKQYMPEYKNYVIYFTKK